MSKQDVFSSRRRHLLSGFAALPATSLLASVPLPASAQAAVKPRGGVLTVTELREPPALVSLINTSALKVSAKVTEGLFRFDFDLKPIPLLAETWEVAPDGLTYTFNLRKGVKWHDGKDFTSDDVEFSILTQKRLHSRGRTTFAQVSRIEKPDAHTIILHLDKPTPFLLTALSSTESPIVPKHVYGDADPATHPNNTAPIGTGPFVFKEWVRGSHIIWDRNPNYWNPDLPYVDRVVAKIIPDMAAATVAFENQTVDLSYRTPVPFRDVARLAKLPHIGIEKRGYEYSPPNIFLLEFNLDQEWLREPRVRQAFAHAIDRDAIVRVVYSGLATASASAVVPYHKEFHNPKPSPYAYDPAKAEQLLEEAGYPKRANGSRLDITLDYYGEDRRLLVEFLRAAFARVGINATLRGHDSGAIIKRVYSDRDYQLHLASVSNFFDPSLGVQRLFWSKNIIKGVAYSNGTGYRNDRVDALLEAAATEPDHAKRVADWWEIQDIVARELPSIPLVSPDWQTIYNKRVHDHTVDAEGYEGALAFSYLQE